MLLSHRERSTVLAALRYWQYNRLWEAKLLPEYDIASDNFSIEPLGDEEIDRLCDRINQENT